jgi:serine/threonine-protein kinase
VYYTPLEQYGGDTGNTDARSDVYAFGATLYHLLTNEPPAEAKQRFLRPEALKPPRTLNPAISLRVEKAMLWAMAMHPDDRPPDILTLRNALRPDTGPLTSTDYGDTIVVQPLIRLPALSTAADRYLAAVAAGLLFLAFAATFLIPLGR